MEGAPPSSGEDDVNFTLNQLELDTLMSELPWLPPEEVPVNQSSMLCNDQAGQNKFLSIEFHCRGCRNMKNLFPLVLLPNLVNLEKIIVKDCEKMEEIIGGTRSDEEGVMDEESNTELKLPNLRFVELRRLPELKSICRAKLICDSLELIQVANCVKLKRNPICLPLLENGQPSLPSSLERITAYPKWETS